MCPRGGLAGSSIQEKLYFLERAKPLLIRLLEGKTLLHRVSAAHI
jgi:hypothetical protein